MLTDIKTRPNPASGIGKPAVRQRNKERSMKDTPSILKVKNFSFFYSGKQALYDISMDIHKQEITAFIGPSGCGKSTLLRSFNRMNDLIDATSHAGDITLNGISIFDKHLEVISLRRMAGMVFQKSNPFPKSIMENVIYGLKIAGYKDKSFLDEVMERSLKSVALWDEVKDRLSESALALSGGQMQRLCIARAIANDPEILLMDEPCSALDPIATAKIEELIFELRKKYTIIIVTHNMQQASRVSDKTAFFYLGKLIEYGPTQKIFTDPVIKQTEDYVTGRFG